LAAILFHVKPLGIAERDFLLAECHSWSPINNDSTQGKHVTVANYLPANSTAGVLASKGWWEAWQTAPKVTRSY